MLLKDLLNLLIMLFKLNRKKKERKEIWKWGDKRIEEVQTFKYLDFILNNKDNYKEH